MSYQDKLDSAVSLINAHNQVIGTSVDEKGTVYYNQGSTDPEYFVKYLKAMGATTEEHLKGMSYEEILGCMFPMETVGGGVWACSGAITVQPKILAKDIAKVFRSGETTEEKRPVGDKKADRMTLRELVEAFDPENLGTKIDRRLGEISKGQPFIVFEDGRKVDVESTLKLLSEVKQGYPGRTDYEVNGRIKQVYKIGVMPNNLVDENPLYPNRPLRPDGTCDKTGRNWVDVPLSVRQLVKIAVDIGELKVNIETAHDILDVVTSPNAESKLRSKYRNASIKFDDATYDKPKLKVALGAENTNIFSNGRKV